ncbi:putative DNA helicase MCM9 [Vitis vinifera]|uniref:Putative DNA helicase MCM9 n=1 Tax=Vitis vinifera TaxID=29760 RepID=A0A438GCS6_VITVI|nr:putative DNA helicase MCM9 [Vitis vinifera]
MSTPLSKELKSLDNDIPKLQGLKDKSSETMLEDDIIVTGILTAKWSSDLKDVRCDLDPVLIANHVSLKVNMDKSELILVGSVENVEDLASELGCKVGSLPSTYLGMLLGAPFKFVVTWDGVEERFHKRLAIWKRRYIFKGGRITLIRSTLSNLPIYFMFILH